MIHLESATRLTVYRVLATTALLLFFTAPFLSAQLSGTYTIGGYKANYPSISAAVAALNAKGVSGSVIFSIRPGAYEEQFVLGPVSGASNYNTITFRSSTGNADDVVVRYAPAPYEGEYVVRFDNARHFRLVNLTLESIHSVYVGVIKVVNQAHDLRIEGCKLLAPELVSAVEERSVVYLNPSVANSVRIHDNIIRGGAYGISFFMSPGAYSAGTQISNNQISFYYHTGVYIANLRGGSFTGNKIDGSNNIPDTALGLRIVGWSGTTASPVLIANNFINVRHGNKRAAGISNSNNIQFFHNSLRQVSDGAVMVLSQVQGAAVLNNIFRASTGYAVYVLNSSDVHMDYNDLYTGGPYLARLNSKLAANLYYWRLYSGYDQRSISVEPRFVSTYDLHARSTSLIGAGVAVAGVAIDIDRQPRANPPCIGADEFASYIKGGTWFGKATVQAVQSGSDLWEGNSGATDNLFGGTLADRSVFPNPVSDALQVVLTDVYTGPVTLTVVDGLGRRISSLNYDKDGRDFRAELAVQHLVPGVYQLQITEGRDVAVERFVKR